MHSIAFFKIRHFIKLAAYPHKNFNYMNLSILQSKIHFIRGEKILLDFDLAVLYEVETRILKQSVRRNDYRFPLDFMFKLTNNEWTEVVTNCDNLP